LFISHSCSIIRTRLWDNLDLTLFPIEKTLWARTAKSNGRIMGLRLDASLEVEVYDFKVIV
jgi:hypothetical protein